MNVNNVISGYNPRLDFTVDYTTTQSILDSYYRVVSPETISSVKSPVGNDGLRMLKAVVPNTATGGVTANPRMQAGSDYVIEKGDEFWLYFDIVFPSTFPVVGLYDGFIQVCQFYGAPFGGGATFTLTSRSDGTYDTAEDNLRWSPNRDNPQIKGLIWKHKIYRGIKHRYAIRMKVTDSLETGYVEIWYDRSGTGYQQQVLYGGVTRLPIILWGSVNSEGPGRTEMQVYRREGEYDSVTLYHGNHKIRGSLPDDLIR